LEEAAVLRPVAGIPRDGVSWISTAGSAAARDKGQTKALGACEGAEEALSALGPHRKQTLNVSNLNIAAIFGVHVTGSRGS
jgi:hypothetical protein